MDIKKILAVRDDRMGDFILTLPAIKALKETFPTARMTVAVSLLVFPLAARTLKGENLVSESGSFANFLFFLRCGREKPTQAHKSVCSRSGCNREAMSTPDQRMQREVLAVRQDRSLP